MHCCDSEIAVNSIGAARPPPALSGSSAAARTNTNSMRSLVLLLAPALARKTTREERHAIASLPTVSSNPLVSLEHINLSSGDEWSARVDAFYFDVLRCARDPRSPAVLARTNSARAKQNRPGVANQSWANIGFQQFHLLFGDGLDAVSYTHLTLPTICSV